MCNDCKKPFFMYKYSATQQRVYANTATNILRHPCKEKARANQKLPKMLPKELTAGQRNSIACLYANVLIENPTVSHLAGVKMMNSVANEASKFTYSHNQVYKFDISRQLVAKTISEQGRVAKKIAVDFFKKKFVHHNLLLIIGLIMVLIL